MKKTSEYFNNVFYILNNKTKTLDIFYKQIDLSLLDELISSNTENLLDLGCGLAPYSSILAKKFKNIFLIDASIELLKKAKEIVCKTNSHANVYAINCNINNLNNFKISNVDLILATGASLCYQKNTLVSGLEISFNKLRSGGVIYGDVWNKYGLLISDAYSDDIPLICLKSSLLEIQSINDFLEKGETLEVVNNYSKSIYATDPNFLSTTLSNIGFKEIRLYGRKTLYLIWCKRKLSDMINKKYTYVFELEKFLSKLEFFMAVSPKITFSARKE